MFIMRETGILDTSDQQHKIMLGHYWSNYSPDPCQNWCRLWGQLLHYHCWASSR